MATSPDSAEDIDDIPVQLVLELGRLDLRIGDVRDLAPGVVLPVAGSADDAVAIVVNGRRIGQANLVKIGERLGVQITRMSNGS